MLYSKQSLEQLKQKVNLVEVLESHLELKRSGSSYKALCPFHEERSPSFTVQRGDQHYHCFGCGAHGDAISFLMGELGLSFKEAVESLAERYNVPLERLEEDEKGPDRKKMAEVLEEAKDLYHAWLLHAEEAKPALQYLLRRGLDLDFIRTFEIGLSPKNPHFLKDTLGRYPLNLLEECGLVTKQESGRTRDFFIDRITFPIHSPMGRVIGFSARKWHEKTTGGKYINTRETPLFKKSHILFGMHLCRRRIAKERRAIIVEGQIDALRLIHGGLDLTVASLGTAFGQHHVQELVKLGVTQVYILFDKDNAGQEAMRKCGDLFMKSGIEVRVPLLPAGDDPDSFVQREGMGALIQKLKGAPDYLTAIVEQGRAKVDLTSPAAVNRLIHELSAQIQDWDDPVLIHQSLRKLASLFDVPERVVGVDRMPVSAFSFRRKETVGSITIDPDAILEGELLHWLLRGDKERIETAKKHVQLEAIRTEALRPIYQTLIERLEPIPFLELAEQIKSEEAEQLLTGILSKKVNHSRSNELFKETLLKLLDRDWMAKCDTLRQKIQSGSLTDDEAIELAKEFDSLRKNPPKIQLD